MRSNREAWIGTEKELYEKNFKEDMVEIYETKPM